MRTFDNAWFNLLRWLFSRSVGFDRRLHLFDGRFLHLHGTHVDRLDVQLVVHEPGTDRAQRSQHYREPLDRGVELANPKSLSK